jgi:hypothetical protein
MARGIQNFPNIISPDSDYPSGRIKDDTGANDGTPIDEETNGDIQEFFAKLMRLAAITPNTLPDNEYSGHQYVQALWKYLRNEIGPTALPVNAEYSAVRNTYTVVNDIVYLKGMFTRNSGSSIGAVTSIPFATRIGVLTPTACMVFDNTGAFAGIGYVTFIDPDNGSLSIQFNGSPIPVNYSVLLDGLNYSLTYQ